MVQHALIVSVFSALLAVNASAQQKTSITPFPVNTLFIQKTHPDSLSYRKWLVSGFHISSYTGTLLLLNNAWYKNYPKVALHSFNDSKEWLQMDKIGHAWSSYGLSRSSFTSWKWSGMSDKKATLLGSLSGFSFLTVIEILDGKSQKWGWSWSDMAANAFGTSLFLGQQLAWKEQRIMLKFSFHKNNYQTTPLNTRADDLFGASWYERMLKDYNGQTYWLSTNLKSLNRDSHFPPWLNIAVGYGAEGMFGGFENREIRIDGSVPFDRRDIARVRQFYLSPDIDFQRLGSKNKWVKTLCFILNGFKFPAPALMLDSRGNFHAYWFYF